jgi:hypothetical protein
MDAIKLQNIISGYSGGSDGRYRHAFNPRFIYTEGVSAVAEAAGAFWLLDIVATEVAPISLKLRETARETHTFLHVDVEKDAARLYLDDGNEGGKVLWERLVEFTDFPAGKWTFYLCMDGIIQHPQEVLVMLLPSEY